VRISTESLRGVANNRNLSDEVEIVAESRHPVGVGLKKEGKGGPCLGELLMSQ
jgi:hypothetical protein